jgi:glycosyltransferase involved in cell wall biosynthesis
VSSRPRVLVLSYHFPPLGGGGVQRWVKHVKYLPDAGWEPIVLTTRSSVYHARDATLTADLPADLTVLRARELSWGRRLRSALVRVGLPAPRILAGWPDAHAGWIPDATRQALAAVRHRRPAVMVSTSPAVSAHVVGLLVARATGIPWVADFRDEFVHNPWPDPKPRLVQTADNRLEAAVCRTARRVLVTADAAQIVGAPSGHPKRITLTNGIDRSDLDSVAVTPADDRFRLSFVGSLYREIDLAPVLAAVRRLAARGAIDPGACEVRVVGNVGVRDLDAGPVSLVRTGYVDHAGALEEMASAGLLICYVPPQGSPTPGKIFEYLASGRPVLCVTRQDNFAWRLVEDLGAGICADPRDDAGIEAAIATLHAEWRAGRLGNPPTVRDTVLARFSRERLALDLARILDEACGEPHAFRELIATPARESAPA